MKMEKKVLIPVLAIAFVALFALAFVAMPQNPSDDDNGISIAYHSNVCKQVIRADGSTEDPECDHNLLYNSGKDLIKTYLGDTGGATDEVDQISLCDAAVGCAAPVAAASEAFNAITNRGLQETTGTYASVGTGNWTISNTFTATAAVTTNATRLQNTAGTNFAGNNFTLVSLQNGDQLSITWNIWVE